MFISACSNRRQYRIWFPALVLLLICAPVPASAQQRMFTYSELTRKNVHNELLHIAIQGQMMARTNLDSAVVILHHLLERSKATADYNGIFEGYFALGAIYVNKSDYRQAEVLYRQALAHSIKTTQPVANSCRALNNLGNIFQYQADYRQAAYYYFRAAEVAASWAGRDSVVADQLIRIYNNTSRPLIELHEYDRALLYLDRAETQANRLHRFERLPSILNNKAIVYRKTERWKEAWEANVRSLELSRQLALYQTEYEALQGMGDVLMLNDEPAAAIDYLLAALNLKMNMNPQYLAQALYSLGCAYFMLKDYDSAEHYLLRALNKAAESKLPLYTLLVHGQLATLYEIRKDFDQAFPHLRAAYMLNDSILHKEKTNAVNLYEIKYRTAEKDKEITHKQLLIKIQERQLDGKNILIKSIAAGLILLILLFISFYRNYRHKKRLQDGQIRVLQQQQQINQLKAQIKGEEQERIRMARELHDGIVSQLLALKLNVDTLRQRTERAVQPWELGNIFRQLDETTRELRTTAHNLIPDLLLKEGLEAAIATFCDKMEKSSGVHINFQVFGMIPAFDPSIELSLYRMIQELVQNALKHAQATNIIVQLGYRDNLLSTTVEDNGKGCSEDTLHAAEGAGLNNIRERLKVLNGNMDFVVNKDNGTAVYIEFNLQSLSSWL